MLYTLYSTTAASFLYATYLKKLGLINLRIAPIIPSRANQIATFFTIFFHESASPDAHCTPPTTIIINHANKITVTSILEIAPIMVGKALIAATSPVVPSDFARQFQTNGMSVLRGIHAFHALPSSPYLQSQ
jgi:hypothetical protein